MSPDDALAVLGLLLVLKNNKNKNKNKRKMWCNSLVQLLNQLKVLPKDWYNHLRMSDEMYLNLLFSVTPLIRKNYTVMRIAILLHDRLTKTL